MKEVLSLKGRKLIPPVPNCLFLLILPTHHLIQGNKEPIANSFLPYQLLTPSETITQELTFW